LPSTPFIHLSGKVDKTDWAAWQEALQRNAGKVDTVVFHNSPGGDSATGRRIGHSIRENKLRTVVDGPLRLRVRQYVPRRNGAAVRLARRQQEIVLGYHGSYNKRDEGREQEEERSYFSELTDGKMDDELIERFIRIEKKSGGALAVPSQLSPTARALLYWRRAAPKARASCASTRRISTRLPWAS
jgi:hypothetical protein